MEILHLTLKKKWFDMILYGDKREEYREIKNYWTKRLDFFYDKKLYTHIKFTNGYGDHRPCFVIELKSISINYPFLKWVDGNNSLKKHYVLKLGEVLATN